MVALHISAVAWCMAAAWVAKLAEAAAGMRRLPHLWDPGFDASPEGNPRIALVVPARDEAANIGACVGSLLAQDYSNLHVIAVNDRSGDSTGAILDQLAAARDRDRLTALHVSELPAGWLGKTHAMALAARNAIEHHAPDYILFTDADVCFAPDAIRRSLVAAVRCGADHFVTLPTTVAKSNGEAVLLACLQVISMWAARTWRATDPKAKRDAIGVGAFNLLRREVYEQLGGFEGLRLEVLEDLTLGRMVKQAGYRQVVAVAPGMVSLHWAPGIAGIVRGMTKNIFAVFEYRLPMLMLAAVATAVLFIGPLAFLADSSARVPALLAWSAATGLYALSSRVSRLPVWCAALMPFGALLVVYAMLRSALLTLVHGGVLWRGTFYPLAALRQHQALRKDGRGGASDSR